MLVSQILSSKPPGAIATVPPGARVAEAAELLSAKRIGAKATGKDEVQRAAKASMPSFSAVKSLQSLRP